MGCKGFVRKGCSPSLQSTTSREFLLNSVPKKGGQIRPVINLKKLNEWVVPQHFKVEGISTLRELLKANDWMVKIDLKDAYFTIPIHPTHQPFLRFTTLPVYMPLIQPVLCSMGVHKSDETHNNLPSKYGVRIIVYIYDLIVMGESPAQVKDHLEALIYLLTGLGFVINILKSITTPAQKSNIWDCW